jgi:hypothetical protein
VAGESVKRPASTCMWALNCSRNSGHASDVAADALVLPVLMSDVSEKVSDSPSSGSSMSSVPIVNAYKVSSPPPRPPPSERLAIGVGRCEH